MKVSFEIANLQQALQKFEAFDAAMLRAFAGATYLFACQIITIATRLAPAVTGWLRSSHYVTKPSLGGGEFVIEAGFSATYAYWVEVLDRNHHDIGQARFLATALAQMRGGGAIIARYTKSLYKSGGEPNSPLPTDRYAGGGRLGHAGAERKAAVRRVKIYRKRLRQTRRRAAEARALRWE